MPLHLLSKKSWHVYSTVNVEKVKRDEAAAAALEAAEEERMQDADAQRRMQILRGEEPTPLAIEDTSRRSDSNRDGYTARDSWYGYGRERKRRKRAGENDTDFEMRIIAEDREESTQINNQLILRKPTEVPLVDHRGNISLFPEDIPSTSTSKAGRADKNPEAEREAARKKREYEDQYTMRFSNAAGFKQSLDKPWYSLTAEERVALREEEEKALLQVQEERKWERKWERKRERRDQKDRARLAQNFDTKGKEDYGGEIPQRDVWGNEDPMRKERVLKRMVDSDPLAIMKAGARQVRKVEGERKVLREEREKGMRELKELEHLEMRRRRERKRERDDLEDFRLDEPVRESHSERKKRKQRHEDEGSEEGELESRPSREKVSSSSRHGYEGRGKVSEKDRERSDRHKGSRRSSSHREEGRHNKHRHRSRGHDYD